MTEHLDLDCSGDLSYPLKQHVDFGIFGLRRNQLYFTKKFVPIINENFNLTVSGGQLSFHFPFDILYLLEKMENSPCHYLRPTIFLYKRFYGFFGSIFNCIWTCDSMYNQFLSHLIFQPCFKIFSKFPAPFFPFGWKNNAHPYWCYSSLFIFPKRLYILSKFIDDLK